MPLCAYAAVRAIDPYFMAYARADQFVFLLLAINVLAPAVSMLIMIRHGIISSVEIKDRRERTGPFLLVLCYYIISYILLRWKNPGLPNEVFSFFLAVICSLALALLASQRWKISIHMLGVGGATGTLLALHTVHRADVLSAVIIALAISALTGFSRIYLGVHKTSEVYAGFGAGLLINWLVLASSLVI